MSTDQNTSEDTTESTMADSESNAILLRCLQQHREILRRMVEQGSPTVTLSIYVQPDISASLTTFTGVEEDEGSVPDWLHHFSNPGELVCMYHVANGRIEITRSSLAVA